MDILVGVIVQFLLSGPSGKLGAGARQPHRRGRQSGTVPGMDCPDHVMEVEPRRSQRLRAQDRPAHALSQERRPGYGRHLTSLRRDGVRQPRHQAHRHLRRLQEPAGDGDRRRSRLDRSLNQHRILDLGRWRTARGLFAWRSRASDTPTTIPARGLVRGGM